MNVKCKIKAKKDNSTRTTLIYTTILSLSHTVGFLKMLNTALRSIVKRAFLTAPLTYNAELYSPMYCIPQA